MTQEFSLECDGIEPSITIIHKNGHQETVNLMYRDDEWHLDDGEHLASNFSSDIINAIYQQIDALNLPVTKSSAPENDRLDQANTALLEVCETLDVKLSISNGEIVFIDMHNVDNEIIINKNAQL